MGVGTHQRGMAQIFVTVRLTGAKKGVHVKEDVIRDICVSKGKQVGTTLKLKQ